MVKNTYKLIRITAAVSKFITADYTAKFVKAVLIKANKYMEEVFESEKYPSPKPILITPLIKENPVYPKVIIRNFGMSEKPKTPPKPIEIYGEYDFFIGMKSDIVEPEVMKAVTSLMGGVKVTYGNFEVTVKLKGFEEIERKVEKARSYVVKFVTPAVFRDPFEKIADLKTEKIRRFIPFPPFIFSVNIYELFRATYKRDVIRLAYSLIESHNNLNTITKVWYYYDKEWLPGVIGYAKFFLRKRLSKVTVDKIIEILNHANVMGVGTGRAAGFGFVEIKSKT
ncbi:CRISPR system precrRNA processing endoribonuclease RAMP protein Cas6 [Saccharolobus islandicus]|uniref:CRISPR-associated protein Cas6 C-terminal domain-containing protein n=1 Tax=Saccharolobus islandicus (strain L.D.8.5 / Lassen \|nr:CRISPR system precrRNA processing endoribonuclease RAMP protein Cas6 [Sulfolobus islandicus]ADB86688.1 conserved hypothetical protein [Sulfolobus islandicus L.D.8.5]